MTDILYERCTDDCIVKDSLKAYLFGQRDTIIVCGFVLGLPGCSQIRDESVLEIPMGPIRFSWEWESLSWFYWNENGNRNDIH